MKIGITGGSGFIGSRLVPQLKAAGHEVIVLDRNASPAVDITKAAAVRDALKGADAVYHLAAEHRDDVRPKRRYYEVNVGGAEALVEAAEAHRIQTILFTSTVAVYGLNADEVLEADAAAPFNDYSRSKWQAEEILNAWAAADAARQLVTLRLAATFGPGNRGNVYNLMDQIARGRFLMVGSGENRKSIAYVENVAAFLAHCLRLGTGRHLYNYADKPDFSMRDMVRWIRGALDLGKPALSVPYPIALAGGWGLDLLAGMAGKSLSMSAVRVRKFCADTVVNADKAHALSGFAAPYSLQEGLRAMLEAEFSAKLQAAAG